ncbi:MAG: TonB-dependent receptor [Woeseia sp.]
MKHQHHATSRIGVPATMALLLAGAFYAWTPGTALAQAGDAEEVIEEVQVTASRIRRTGFDTVQPAVIIDGEFMQDRGFVNINDALEEMPAFGLSVNERGDAETQEIGLNFANAFGLGSARTLTLIDGRRVVSSNAPTTVDNNRTGPGLQVDLNVIPTLAIERVETVFTGGAPIYGSDAVAGTVNLIMKDSFEGLQIDTQYGISERGEKEELTVRGLWGGNTANGRGNFMIATEYSTFKPVRSEDNDIVTRADGFCENPNDTGPDDGIPDRVFCQDGNNIFAFPNTALPGRIIDPATGQPVSTSLVDSNGNRFSVVISDPFDTDPHLIRDAMGNPLIFDVDGSLITFEQANVGVRVGPTSTQGANGFTNPIVSDTQLFNALVGSKDRWNLYGKGEYEFTENTNWFMEGMFSRLEASNIREQPRFFSDVFGNNQLRPSIAINITENPFVTDQVRDIMQLNGVYDPTLVDGDGNPVPQYFKISRSNVDIEGDSPFDREQDFFRFVTGLEGEVEFLNRAWTWDAAVNYGETNAFTQTNQIDALRLMLALDAIEDPVTGQPVCRAQVEGLPTGFENVAPTSARNTAVNECIPFNPLGLNPVTEAQHNYLVQPEFRKTEIQQQVYEANIGGELFQMPAGALDVYTGVTHRREFGAFFGDRTSRNALSESAPVQNVQGKFDTTEFYGEALLPIVRNSDGLPWNLPIVTLELEGAIRSVDNSIAGRDNTWTVGGRLRPSLPFFEDGVIFRGNVTQSIRAPAIPELFLPQQQVRVFASDPCDPRFIDGGSSPDVRRANCEAEAPAGFDLSTFDSLIVGSRREAVSGGNPNLQNETADSWTIGAVFEPPFVDGLTFSVDWTDMEITDAIEQLSATDVMNACYDSTNFPGAAPCSNFTRESGTFQVATMETGFVNAAELRFQALIANFRWMFDAADLPLLQNAPGNMEFFGNYFHVAKLEREVGVGDIDIQDGEAFNEKHQWQLNLRYNLNALSVLWQTRYVGEHVLDNQAAPELRAPEESKVDAMWLNNLMANYQVNDSIGVRLIINNVFDERDDPLRAASLGGNDLGFTDPFGRRYLLAVNMGF